MRSSAILGNVTQPAASRRGEPLIIHVNVDGTGITFSLGLSARRRLERDFGVHASPRVFVGHETRAAFEEIHGPMLRQLVLVLTGVDEDRLRDVGPIEFREPVTERLLKRMDL